MTLWRRKSPCPSDPEVVRACFPISSRSLRRWTEGQAPCSSCATTNSTETKIDSRANQDNSLANQWLDLEKTAIITVRAFNLLLTQKTLP